MEKELEGRRMRSGSERVLTNACVGRSTPSTVSSFSCLSPTQKTGSSGSSLPGRYMLSCSGRNAGAFLTGDMRPDWTFLKSVGAPITGRLAGLFFSLKLS